MKNITVLALTLCFLATSVFAASRKITVSVDWAKSNQESVTALAFLKKCVVGYREAGHPVAMKATLREGGQLPAILVIGMAGEELYSGSDKNAAAVAMTEAIMNIPIPGQMISGVTLKKFRGADRKFVMGKTKGEGYALSPFKTALKSKKPAEVQEAQAILDSIERSKKNLEKDIAACLADGSKEAKGEALRDIRWFIATWPSEKEKYAAQFKKLSADPEAKAEEAALLKAMKKRK